MKDHFNNPCRVGPESLEMQVNDLELGNTIR